MPAVGVLLTVKLLPQKVFVCLNYAFEAFEYFGGWLKIGDNSVTNHVLKYIIMEDSTFTLTR